MAERLKIKTGDRVQVLVGRDRGKSGKVIQVFPTVARVVIEGINQRRRHLRPRRGTEKGQTVTFFAPLHVSNVALLCPKCGKPTRVAMRELEGGKRVRACKKCREVI